MNYFSIVFSLIKSDIENMGYKDCISNIFYPYLRFVHNNKKKNYFWSLFDQIKNH